MYNIFRKRTGNHDLPVLILDGIWQVDGDRTYHIRPAKDWPDTSYIAVRTENGAGILRDRSNGEYLLERDSLLFLSADQIAEYWAGGESWKFFWFEFQCADRSFLPARQIFKIPFSASEREQIRECYLNLDRVQKDACLLSQADFLRLIFFWMVSAPNPEPASCPDLIALLENGGRQCLSVPEISREAGMCQRSFRAEIHRLTGLSPAEYLTKMKMDTAMEMLCSTDLNLQEISDSLHYGNPFYFGRVFKQYFGISPGKARQQFSAKYRSAVTFP